MVLILFLLIGNSCITSESDNYPDIELKNENLKVTVYLPDGTKGYYRGIRFDWAGMIKQAEYRGHTFFGELKGIGKHHNPTIHDHGVGPCEEFGMKIPVNFDQVKAEEPFLKIGVGVLEKKLGEKRKYWFPIKYKIIKLFSWQIKLGKNSIGFTQHGECPGGWQYDYEKTVIIDKTDPVLKIHHKLKNTGDKPIKTDFYSHNMLIFDEQPIGNKYQLKLPFIPTSSSERPKKAVWEKNELKFLTDTLQGSYRTQVEGFSKEKKENVFTVAVGNVSLNAATDYNLHAFQVYAENTALCPEPFILIDLASGDIAEWTTTFTFKVE